MQKEALLKAANFCAYQERTHEEVRERLKNWGVFGEDAEEIIVRLIEENFLNEERFSKIYAGSKFRVKQWGRLKIKYEMKLRGLSEYNIRQGLAEIPEDDYEATLRELIEKKRQELRHEKQAAVVKQKIARFVIGKGFESNLVWQMINKMIEK